ncbi:MAG: hypothetical protein ABI968_06625 [Acidobacteriota bacterium]
MKASALAGRGVTVATLLAVGLGVLLFFSGYQSLIYDAFGFAELARRLSHGGFAAAAYEWRTYGYPLFVAICTGFRALDPKTVRLCVFLAQLFMYLAVCAAGARMLGAIVGSSAFARAVYFATALNPFLLARTTETLSDSLSAVLVSLGVLLSFPPAKPPKAAPVNVARRAAASLFCVSFATMVRPSNLAVLLAVCVLWLLRQAIWKELRITAAPLLLAALLLPVTPQLYSNFRAFGKLQPLVVESLYRDQAHWGMSGLKYGAALWPGGGPQLLYRNPLYRSEPSPRAFLRERPLAYAATTGLHLFAMFDHDLLLTYSVSAHPWYRWPLSIIDYAFLFLCLAGIVVFLRRRFSLSEPLGFAGFGLLFASAASVSVYLPTLVESRFSAPAELLLTPFGVLALARIREIAARGDRRLLIAGAVAGALFVGSCGRLSGWIAAQAPRLAVPQAQPRA